jgi:hypothetical protein
MINPMQRVRRLVSAVKDVRLMRGELDEVRLLMGLIASRQCAQADADTIAENEFSVYSQFGEDGIIQWLLRKVRVTNRIFVEFGVEDYQEANTRFLLMNNRWTGLVLDGSSSHVARINADPDRWRHPVTARCAFIDRENINELILGAGIEGDIGLLSIDIDGNDYWVWRAITAVRPRIVVCEYNSLFGARSAVTIPYEPTFVRARAHYSSLYFGASLPALTHLSRELGYSLVGSSTMGNNAFFVRDDLVGDLPVLTPETAWIEAGFRESRNRDGSLSHLEPQAARALIADLPLLDVEADVATTVGRLQL